MFLGTAESVAGSDELFIQDNQAAHIYRKRAIRRSEPASFPRARTTAAARIPRARDLAQPGQSTERQMFEALALSLGKNSILVTDEYSIVRIYGNVSQFIEMSEASSLKMHIDLLRRPFREEARSLVTLALKSGEQRIGVRHLLHEDAETEIRLDVYPIIAKDINERAALVVFSEHDVDRSRGIVRVEDYEEGSPEGDRIRHLEDEVANTREALQQTIEELETSNEELQSLNEELQSTNEELQATNEELETSNEELQSTNEELITVNEELQVTAAELSGRTGELISVLETAPLAIMVLDTALQITQATNRAADMFNLSRPISNPHISQCALPENFPSLAPICNETLKLGEAVVREFSSNGSQIKLNSSPFFDMRGQMKGVTIVISEFPGLALELDLILNNAEIFMMNRGPDGTIYRISETYANALGTTRKDAEGDNFYKIAGVEVADVESKKDRKLLTGDANHLSTTETLKSKETGQPLWLMSERFVFSDQTFPHDSIYTVGTNITQVVMLQDIAKTGYWSLDLINQEVYWSTEVYRIHGEDPDSFEVDLSKGLSYYYPEDRPFVERSVNEVAKNGGQFKFKKRLVQRGGDVITVESIGIGKANELGEIERIIGVFRQVDDEAE
jgi:two-component system CheB/CheR fusion protein